MDGALERDGPIPALLLERIALLASETGRPQAAIRTLVAARQRLLLANDAYGAFRMTLRMAQVCLTAAQPAAAANFLSEAVRGRPAPILAEELASQLSRIEQLSWARLPQLDLTAGRVDAAMTLASYYAAVGHYAPAIAASELALRLLPGARLVFSESQVRLFVAELRLERGELQEHEETGDGVPAEDPQEPLRWQALQARRALLGGRLSEARAKLESIAASRHLAAPRLESQVTQMLAYVLGLLNRLDDAEALLDDLDGRLRLAGPNQLELGKIHDLQVLLRRRLRRQSDELLLPFVPEQAIDAERASASSGAPLPANAAAVKQASPHDFERCRQRFAAEWGHLANRVLLELDAGSLELARERLEQLIAFVAATDSERLHARTSYLRALVAYYSKQFEQAHELALDSSLRATSARLVLDDLQALELLTWTSRRLHRPEHAEFAQRARAAFELVRRGLDDEDRAFYVLNRTTQQEEFVTLTIARLLVTQPVRPGLFRWLREWWARRRHRKAVLLAYAEISYLRHWNVEQLTPDTAQTTPPKPLVRPDHATESMQIQSWVREELRLQRAGSRRLRHRRLLDRPRPLHAIPKGVAIVDYQVSARQLQVLVLQHGEIQAFAVPTTRVALYQAVRQVIVECSKQAALGSPRRNVDAAFARLAEALGVRATLEPLVERIQHLVVIPSDSLVHVPFAGLPCAGQRWCDHFATSLVPSINAVQIEALAAKQRLRSGRLLGVSVEKYPGTALTPLLRAAEEIEAVARAAAFQSLSHLRDEQAAPSAVLEGLPRSDWAHFACHGTFDRDMPHQSRLHLGGPREQHRELTLGQLQLSPLSALQGIVLASCWTSSTAVLPGGELVCLPNALLKAGARQVIAPLWSTYDERSVDFMTAFYAAMRSLPPAAALASVQREWAAETSRERRAKARPYHWAGYVHYGCG